MSTIKSFVDKQVPKEKELAAKEKIEKIEKREKNEKAEKDKEGKDQKDTKEQKDSKEQKEHKEKTEKEQKERKEKLEKEHKEKVEKHEKQEKEHPDKQLPIEKQAPVESMQQAMTFDPTSIATGMTDPQSPAIFKLIEKFPDKYWYFDKFHRDKLYKVEKYEIPELWTPFTVGDIPDPYALAARVAALEGTVGQLMHFIPQESRPDLSTGALKNEAADQASSEESVEEADEADSGDKA